MFSIRDACTTSNIAILRDGRDDNLLGVDTGLLSTRTSTNDNNIKLRRKKEMNVTTGLVVARVK
jgi:hypothetical protein